LEETKDSPLHAPKPVDLANTSPTTLDVTPCSDDAKQQKLRPAQEYTSIDAIALSHSQFGQLYELEVTIQTHRAQV